MNETLPRRKNSRKQLKLELGLKIFEDTLQRFRIFKEVQSLLHQ